MTSEKKATIWNKDFILLLIVNAFVFISMHMLSTTIAKFSMMLSGTESVAGMVVGSFSICSIIARPVSGNLIDQKNKKKIYMLSLVIILAGILGYSISKSNIMLVLFRLVHGVGWGFATTIGMAIASDTAPEEKVGECVSVYGLANVLAMALAPNLGLIISEKFGYPAMFLTAAAFVVCGIITLSRVKERPVRKDVYERSQKISIDNLLLKEAVFPALVLLLSGMAYNAVTTFLVVYAQGVGIDKPSLFFTVYSVVILFVRLTSGRIVDKKGPDYIIVPSGFFFVGCLCLLGGLKNNLMLYAAAICLGFGYSATLSTLMAVAFMRTTVNRRGMASSTINIGMDIGTGLGSVFGGFLSDWFGYSTMYYMLCIPVILAVLIFVIDQKSFKKGIGIYRKRSEPDIEMNYAKGSG